MYRKIGINNYIDMTKFENDADIRYLLTRYISVILPEIRYQIFNFMYISKFLPDKQISDIYSMQCLAFVCIKLYDILETKWVSKNQNRFQETKWASRNQIDLRKSNQSSEIKWPSLDWGWGRKHVQGTSLNWGWGPKESRTNIG
jgi:hypothetical protein